jgi:hypothetical protein
MPKVVFADSNKIPTILAYSRTLGSVSMALMSFASGRGHVKRPVSGGFAPSDTVCPPKWFRIDSSIGG